jgi:DNA replication protein DnaC
VLPPLYQRAQLVDFDERLKGVAEQWLARPANGLLLLGSAGAGKTYFAAAVARALIESGRTVIFRSAADYYLDLRATFNTFDPDTSEHAVLTRLGDVEFLVLDDVGAGSLSDHERRSTLHLLDRRINNLRPTIVTTNLTVEEIGRAMDERIASRLDGFTAIAMTGRDRRRRARGSDMTSSRA